MPGFSREGGRPAILIATVKSVIIIGAISYVAANWLSGIRFDESGLGRLAFDSGRDPATTGSLGAAANGTKLDPCAVPARR